MAGLWKDSLLVGNAQIDSEHKKLVQAIDALLEACNKGQGRAKVEETLNFVESYTKTHFSHEEALQAQSGYPDRLAHKAMHDGYVRNIGVLKKEFTDTGGGIAFTAKLNKTLVDWLIKHISTEDVKIGKHLSASR